AIKKFIRKLQGYQKYFNVSKRGEFMYKSNAIRGSDMSDLVCSVFTGKPPKNIKGLDEFKKGLIDANIQLPGGDPPPKPKVEVVKEKPQEKRERKSKKRDSQEGYF